MHHVDRLLKLIEIFFQMMMQVGTYRGWRNSLPWTDKQGVIKLTAQALQRLADGGWRDIKRLGSPTDTEVLVNAFEDD